MSHDPMMMPIEDYPSSPAYTPGDPCTPTSSPPYSTTLPLTPPSVQDVHDAAARSDGHEVWRLIEEGAKTNLPLVQVLCDAIEADNVQEVKRLITKEEMNVEVQIYFRGELTTPLHVACLVEHYEVARYLISRGASLEKTSIPNKITPLGSLLLQGYIDRTTTDFLGFLRYVITEVGIDPSTKHSEGRNVLHLLSPLPDEYCYDLVLHVINQPDVIIDAKDDSHRGGTALHWVCRGDFGNNPRMISLLLERCPALLEMKDNKGETPLFWAAQLLQHQTVRLLVHQHGANVNTTNSIGMTLLQQLCVPQLSWVPQLLFNDDSHNYFDHIRELVEELGADPLIGMDGGEAALDYLLESTPQISFQDDSDVEINTWKEMICFLLSKYDCLLPPSTARNLWKMSGDQGPQTDDWTDEDLWQIRMRWVSHHCQTKHGISSEETNQYPIHSLLYLQEDYDTSFIDWTEVMTYFKQQHFVSMNPSGMGPLQLYLSLRKDHFFPGKGPHAGWKRPRYCLEQGIVVVLDTAVVRVLLTMDRRLCTESVIDPFSTPLSVAKTSSTDSDHQAGDDVHLDLLYRIVRGKPEVLRIVV